MTAEEKLAQALDAWLEQHRAECPLPQRECFEPLNVLAWLAHCYGIRAGDVGRFHDLLAEYESTCPDCQHKRNGT